MGCTCDVVSARDPPSSAERAYKGKCCFYLYSFSLKGSQDRLTDRNGLGFYEVLSIKISAIRLLSPFIFQNM